MTIGTSDENKLLYSGADSAFISQNVYLYCASIGLATGVRAFVDKDALAKDMKLRDKQKVVLVQAVGYPQ
jgi:nitroreductase